MYGLKLQGCRETENRIPQKQRAVVERLRRGAGSRRRQWLCGPARCFPGARAQSHRRHQQYQMAESRSGLLTGIAVDELTGQQTRTRAPRAPRPMSSRLVTRARFLYSRTTEDSELENLRGYVIQENSINCLINRTHLKYFSKLQVSLIPK